MILSLQVFGAKMTTAKYTFSICANRGLVAILDITAPHTHGDLSWSTTERGSIEMTGYNVIALPNGDLSCDFIFTPQLSFQIRGRRVRKNLA